MILRDRDSLAGWYEEIEENLRETRVYYAQDCRGDVSALLTDTGSMIEWVECSAYGAPNALLAGDTDSDGSWDAADNDRIASAVEDCGENTDCPAGNAFE
ncbi:MAG: hypothetical protein JJU33_01190 [Phycisphaerales bacterium]|nr:hypothetical protein [Phycisphaerales bacterium]